MATAITPVQFMRPLDSSQAIDQYSLGQKQALIDALKQAAINPPQTPQYGAIASRTSFITPIAQMIGASLAKSRQDALNQQAASLYNRQYGQLNQMMGGDGTQTPIQTQPAQQQNVLQRIVSAFKPNQAPQQQAASPQRSVDMMGSLQTAQDQGQTPDQAQSQPPIQAPSTTGMNPWGIDPRMATNFYAQDPNGYMGKVLDYYSKVAEPIELQRVLRAEGIGPGDPRYMQAMRLAEQKATYIAPTAARPGTTLVGADGKPTFFNPNTPDGSMPVFGPNGMPIGIQQIPGAIPAIAAAEGASTGARISNTPQVFPTGGGGSTIGYPSDVLGVPPGLRGVAGIPQGTTRAAAAPGPTTTTAPTQPAQKEDPWKGMPKLQVSSSIGAPDEFTKGRLQEAGRKDAELSTQYGKEADLADQKIQLNAEASKSLPMAEAGPLSDWMTENRAKLVEMGIPDSLIPGAGKIVPTQELNKYLKNVALQGARQIYGSRMTQTEVQLQTNEMSPSTKMQRLAIQSLIQQDNVRNAYAKQRAMDYGRYVQNGGDPLRFETWYSKNFPLREFAREQERVRAIGSRFNRQQLLEEAKRRKLDTGGLEDE